jgi:site-specific recombinase XerD
MKVQNFTPRRVSTKESSTHQVTELLPPNQTLQETLTLFLSNFMSERTQEAYVADWRSFFLFLEGRGEVVQTPNDVTEGHLIAYRNHLRERYSPTTINRKLSALSSLFSRLKDEQLVTRNPAQGLRRPKAIAKRRRTGFTDQEVTKVLESISIHTLKGLNDKALLAFLFYTGARVSEMLTVRVKDLEVQEGLPVVHLRGKGEKLRTLPVVKVWTLIDEVIKRREKKPDDYLFTPVRNNNNQPMTRVGVHKLIKEHLKKLGMDSSRSAHSARRTVISNLLQSGERLELVQKVAGHSSPTVTLRSYNVREEPLAKNPLLNLRYRD